MGWWAHADMTLVASRLVGLMRICAGGLVGWWAHADMRWWASRLVGSCAICADALVGWWAHALVGWWAHCVRCAGGLGEVLGGSLVFP